MEKCLVCDLTYTTKQNIEEHKLSLMHHIKLEQHTGEHEHTCTICKTTFLSLSGYSKHLTEDGHAAGLKKWKKCLVTELSETLETSESKQSEIDMGKSKRKSRTLRNEEAAAKQGGKKESTQVSVTDGQKKKNKKKNKATEPKSKTESSASDSGTSTGKKMYQGNEQRKSRFDRFSDEWSGGDFNAGPMYNEEQPLYNYSHSAGEEAIPHLFQQDFTSDHMMQQFPPYKRFDNNHYWQSFDRPPFQADQRGNGRGGFQNWRNTNKNYHLRGNPSDQFETYDMGFHEDRFRQDNSRQMRKGRGGEKMIGPNVRRGSAKGHQVSLHASLDRKARDRSTSSGRETAVKPAVKQRSSSLSKKTNNVSSASEDSQPEGSKTLSLKAGRIIDNILKGKTPKGLLGAYPLDKEDDNTPGSPRIMDKPPKPPTKQSQPTKEKPEQNKVFQGQKGKSSNLKDSPNRGAYLLDRAENLCREIREKRELAKRGSKSSLNEDELRTSLSSLGSRSSLNSSVASSHHWLEASADSLSVPIALTKQPPPSTATAKDSAASRVTKEPVISSVKRGLVPHLPGRVRKSSESHDKEKKKDKLDKETMLKLVNSPRSRKERLQVGKILRTFTKQQKQRPKLSLVNAVERQEESESEVNLDELPEDIKNQINLLIEEELHSLDPQETADKGLTVETIQTSLGIDPSSFMTETTGKRTSRNNSGKETVIDLLDEDSNDALEVTSVKLSASAAKHRGNEQSSQQRKEDQSSVTTCDILSSGISSSNTRSNDSPLTLQDLSVSSNHILESRPGKTIDDSGVVSNDSSVQQSVAAYMSSDHVRSLTASVLSLNATYPLDDNHQQTGTMASLSKTTSQVKETSSSPTDNSPVPVPLLQNYMDVDTVGSSNIFSPDENNRQQQEASESSLSQVSGTVTMSSVVEPVSVTSDIYSMMPYHSDPSLVPASGGHSAISSIPASGSQSMINTSFTDSLQKNEFGQFVIEPESSEQVAIPLGDDRREETDVNNIQVGVSERRVDEGEEPGEGVGEYDTGSSGEKNTQAHKRRRSERSPAVNLVSASGCDSNSSGNKVDVKRFRADSEVVETDGDKDSTLVDEGAHQSGHPPYPSPMDCVGLLYELSVQEECVRQELGGVDRQLEELQAVLIRTQTSIRERQQHRTQLIKEEEELRRRRLDMLKGAVNNNPGYLANSSSLNSLSFNRQTSTPDMSCISLHITDQYHPQSDNNYTATPTRTLSFNGSTATSETGPPTSGIEQPGNNNTSTPVRQVSLEGTTQDTDTPSSHIEPLTILPDNSTHMFEECPSKDEPAGCDSIVAGPCVSSSEAFVNSSSHTDRDGEASEDRPITQSTSVDEGGKVLETLKVESLVNKSGRITRSMTSTKDSPLEQNTNVGDKARQHFQIEEADSTVIPSISPDHTTCAADSSSQVSGKNKEKSPSPKPNSDYVLNNNLTTPTLECEEDIGEFAGDDKSESVGDNTGENDISVSSDAVNVGPTVQYMGSFSVPGMDTALLQKLAENFAELKQQPYVFVNSGEAAMEEEQAEKDTEDTGCVSREDSPANTSVDTVVAPQPESAELTNQECEGDGDTEILTDSHTKSRLKSPKRRKSRKNRGVAAVSRHSNLSTSEGEDGNTSLTTATTATSSSPSRKGRKKRCSTPLEKQLVKEYLHAESSTDVEINGLEPKLQPMPASSSTAKNENDENSEEVHDAAITCMCLWQNSLVTGSEDCSVRKTSINQKNPRDMKTMLFVQWDKKVQCIHVSDASGRPRIYAGWEQSCLAVYDYKNRNRFITQTKSFGQDLLCLHERWGILYVGMSKGSVLCFDIKANKQAKVLSVCEKAVTQLSSAVDAGGRELLVVASADCSLTVRNRHSGALIHSVEGHTKSPLALQIDHDLVYSGGMDRCLQVHKWKTGDVEHVVQLGGVIRNIYVTSEDVYVVLQNGVISCYCSKILKLKYTTVASPSTLVLCSTLVAPTAIFCGLKNGSMSKHSISQRQVWACQFGRCDSLLGSRADLEQHLLQDHVLPHDKIMCLWKDCPNVYLHSTQPQKVKKHLQSHLN